MALKHIVFSLLAGIAGSLTLLLTTMFFSALGFSFSFNAYVIYTNSLGWLLSVVAPNSFVYWIAPEGGPVSWMTVMLSSAFIQNTLAIAFAYFWFRWKRAINVHQTENILNR